jgi:hypothetical protein
LLKNELFGVESTMTGRAETKQVLEDVGPLLAQGADVMGIGIEISPLLFSWEGGDPSRAIDPGMANLAVVVIETFDCLSKGCLAVIHGTSIQLYAPFSVVCHVKAKNIGINCLLASACEFFDNPIDGFIAFCVAARPDVGN